MLFGILALTFCFLLAPPSARAAVERKGVWPQNETVSLTLTDVPRSEAVSRLAEQAHWSVVQEGVGPETISLSVHDEPADKVLMMLLSGRDAVVERDGSLVSIRSMPAAQTNTNPSAGSRLATPAKPDEDFFVPEKGHVGKDQVVRDVFVFGSVVIEGVVTGSVVVFGGEARFLKGAQVRQDVIAFGGSLDIEDGVEIGGDVAALFGTLKRGAELPRSCLACGEEKKKDPWIEFFAKLFGDLASAAISWLLGAILIALVPSRVELLRTEVERRPFRNLGLGLLGAVCLLLTVATLAITLIGIPLAIVVFVLSLVASYLGFCVVPLAMGRRVLGERSRNPYVHQAIGCVLLFFILSIPIVGGLFGFAGTLVALGGLVRTRGVRGAANGGEL